MVLKHPDKHQKDRTIVYFIRHGDRIFIPNSPKEESNHPGPGLSKLGKRQAKAVAKKFAGMKNEIDVFISSNMTRAIETAAEIGKVIKKKPKICNEFAEFNKTIWEKKFYHPKFWKHYFKHRLSLKAFDKILEKNKGKVIVIVAHGNVIKGILGKKLKIPFKQIGALGYDNCHISLARFLGKRLEYVPYINSQVVVKGY